MISLALSLRRRSLIARTLHASVASRLLVPVAKANSSQSPPASDAIVLHTPPPPADRLNTCLAIQPQSLRPIGLSKKRSFCDRARAAFATQSSVAAMVSGVGANALSQAVPVLDEPQDPSEMRVFTDMLVSDVLADKARPDVITINEDAMIFDAIKKMNDEKIGALLVRNQAGTDIIGIISERDYLLKVALRGISSRDTPVRQIMTPDPMCCKLSDPITQVMVMMTQHHFRHVPVVSPDQSKVVGMISIGDAVKSVMKQLTDSVSYWRGWVTGADEKKADTDSLMRSRAESFFRSQSDIAGLASGVAVKAEAKSDMSMSQQLKPSALPAARSPSETVLRSLPAHPGSSPATAAAAVAAVAAVAESDSCPVPASPLDVMEEMRVYTDSLVEDMLADKTARVEVLAISEEAMVFEAIQKMDQEKVGALLVRNRGGEVVGIVSERDYLTRVALRGLSSRDTPVSRIMTPNPVFCSTTDRTSHIMRLMTKRRFRHVPVQSADGTKIVGMVSIGDAVKSVITQLNESVSYLRQYAQNQFAYSKSWSEGYRFRAEAFGYHEHPTAAAAHTAPPSEPCVAVDTEQASKESEPTPAVRIEPAERH
jgi:CBS domain-containing protein